MKLVLMALLALLTSALIVGCGGGEQETQTDAAAQTEAAPTTQVVALSLGGMHCDGCANTIQAALGGLDAVKECSVSYADSLAKVTVDAAQLDVQSLIAAVEGVGYRASVVPEVEETETPATE